LLWRYYELLSFKPRAEIDEWRARIAGGENPQLAKDDLAREIVARFHGDAAAATAHEAAGNQVRLGDVPDQVQEVDVSADGQESMPLSAVMRLAGLVKNSNAARDLLRQNVVYVDGQVADAKRTLNVGDSVVIQAGKKKIARVRLKS